MGLLGAIAGRWRRRRGGLGEHLRRVFESLRIEAVVDVGAHRGKYRRFLLKDLGFRGPVLSVEPVAELAEDLARRAAGENNWSVVRCALGAQPGKARLNVMASSDFSSLLDPSPSAPGRFAALTAVTRVEEVPMRTLDELLGGFAPQARRLYLKLDTQGYDLEVLRGAARSLERVAALQSEIAFRPIYAGMPTWRESFERIEALGFAVSGIFPVTREPSLRLIEADCVFVRAE
ncbi:MAG: FkbM family methyltransferase [Betaproteobacteria bacterium]